MIKEIEQETSDLSCFFTNGFEIGFLASGGGKLPQSIADKTLDDINFLADYFWERPAISNCIIIESNLRENAPLKPRRFEYLDAFNCWTEKGLYAFDKALVNNFSDTTYILITKPDNPLKLSELPAEIAALISKTRFNGTMDELLNIALIK